jgi:hypothetical protein
MSPPLDSVYISNVLREDRSRLKSEVRYARMLSSTFLDNTHRKLDNGYFWADFIPSDSEERYQENKTDPEQRRRLVENGWLDEQGNDKNSFRYRLNAEGFRCDNFTNEPGIVFFGCSHTYGIGVSTSDSWPQRVANHFGLQCWNLAHPGQSLSLQALYAATFLTEDIKNIKAIVVMETPDRFEYPFRSPDNRFGFWPLLSYTETRYKPSPLLGELYDGYPIKALFDGIKDQYIIRNVALDLGVPYVYRNVDQICAHLPHKYLDLGRDLLHMGPRTQYYIADQYIKLLEPHFR